MNKKCCYNCKHYKDAKCDILKNGLLPMVIINNLKPGDQQYNYDIKQQIMIKTEFSKELCCSHFEDNKIEEGE